MYVPSQSVFMIYLRVRGHISHIFHSCSLPVLSCVTITNISMQLALLYSELDYLAYNPTSRHGTGYTFTWPRPTVEPVWVLCHDSQGCQLKLQFLWWLFYWGSQEMQCLYKNKSHFSHLYTTQTKIASLKHVPDLVQQEYCHGDYLVVS